MAPPSALSSGSAAEGPAPPRPRSPGLTPLLSMSRPGPRHMTSGTLGRSKKGKGKAAVKESKASEAALMFTRDDVSPKAAGLALTRRELNQAMDAYRNGGGVTPEALPRLMKDALGVRAPSPATVAACFAKYSGESAFLSVESYIRLVDLAKRAHMAEQREAHYLEMMEAFHALGGVEGQSSVDSEAVKDGEEAQPPPSGGVDRDALWSAAETMSLPPQHFAAPEGPKRLSLGSFERLVAPGVSQKVMDEFRKVGAKEDATGTLCMSHEDAKERLSAQLGVRADEVAAFLKERDQDGDGTIDAEEWTELVQMLEHTGEHETEDVGSRLRLLLARTEEMECTVTPQAGAKLRPPLSPSAARHPMYSLSMRGVLGSSAEPQPGAQGPMSTSFAQPGAQLRGGSFRSEGCSSDIVSRLPGSPPQGSEAPLLRSRSAIRRSLRCSIMAARTATELQRIQSASRRRRSQAAGKPRRQSSPAGRGPEPPRRSPPRPPPPPHPPPPYQRAHPFQSHAGPASLRWATLVKLHERVGEGAAAAAVPAAGSPERGDAPEAGRPLPPRPPCGARASSARSSRPSPLAVPLIRDTPPRRRPQAVGDLEGGISLGSAVTVLAAPPDGGHPRWAPATVISAPAEDGSCSVRWQCPAWAESHGVLPEQMRPQGGPAPAPSAGSPRRSPGSARRAGSSQGSARGRPLPGNFFAEYCRGARPQRPPGGAPRRPPWRGIGGTPPASPSTIAAEAAGAEAFGEPNEPGRCELVRALAVQVGQAAERHTADPAPKPQPPLLPLQQQQQQQQRAPLSYHRRVPLQDLLVAHAVLPHSAEDPAGAAVQNLAAPRLPPVPVTAATALSYTSVKVPGPADQPLSPGAERRRHTWMRRRGRSPPRVIVRAFRPTAAAATAGAVLCIALAGMWAETPWDAGSITCVGLAAAAVLDRVGDCVVQRAVSILQRARRVQQAQRLLRARQLLLQRCLARQDEAEASLVLQRVGRQRAALRERQQRERTLGACLLCMQQQDRAACTVQRAARQLLSRRAMQRRRGELEQAAWRESQMAAAIAVQRTVRDRLVTRRIRAALRLQCGARRLRARAAVSARAGGVRSLRLAERAADRAQLTIALAWRSSRARRAAWQRRGCPVSPRTAAASLPLPANADSPRTRGASVALPRESRRTVVGRDKRRARGIEWVAPASDTATSPAMSSPAVPRESFDASSAASGSPVHCSLPRTHGSHGSLPPTPSTAGGETMVLEDSPRTRGAEIPLSDSGADKVLECSPRTKGAEIPLSDSGKNTDAFEASPRTKGAELPLTDSADPDL